MLREEGIALGKIKKYSDLDIKTYATDTKKFIARKM